VDISTRVIPGQYVPLVASYGVLGHGQLLALGQNVLPTGAISLDPISIEPGNSPLPARIKPESRQHQVDLHSRTV